MGWVLGLFLGEGLLCNMFYARSKLRGGGGEKGKKI